MNEEIKDTQESPVVDEPTKNDDVKYEDRNSYQDPVLEAKQVTFDSEKGILQDGKPLDKEYMAIPSNTINHIAKFIAGLDKLSEELRKNLTEQDYYAISIDQAGSKNTLTQDIYKDNLDNHEFINMPTYGNKKLIPRALSSSSKGGEVKGSSALNIFSMALGIGEYVEVPLYHSGFWITLRPPKQSEIITLETNLANLTVSLGRDTTSIVYSNYSVIANRHIVEFIKDHIYKSSLKLKEDDDILNYINVQDLQSMVLGLVISMYPNGIDLIRPCTNASAVDENGMPKCDYVATVKVDPKKLLFVNRKALPNNCLETLAKKLPNSVTTDETLEYQNSIAQLAPKDVTFKTDNDKEVTITFKTPMLAKYIVSGESWVQNIITKTEELFTDSDTKESKNKKVEDMLSTYLLGIYNTFVYKISTSNDGVVHTVTDETTIDNILEVMSTDRTMLTEYIDKVAEFITHAAIAVVGIPAYECPKCKAIQDDSKANEDLRSIIPLNMVENFFDLSALRGVKRR